MIIWAVLICFERIYNDILYNIIHAELFHIQRSTLIYCIDNLIFYYVCLYY